MAHARSTPPRRSQVNAFTDRVKLAELVHKATELRDAGKIAQARGVLRQAEKLRKRAAITD
jgi:hypothetical protein